MTIEINVPDIGVDEVEVTEVMVSVGDIVEAEQPLLTVEGDKAAMEVPAPFAGTVKEIKINVGDKVSTGSQIMVFDVEDTQPTVTNQMPVNTNNSTVTTPAPSLTSCTNRGELLENAAYVHATPVIRRLAREYGINLEKIKGSGRKGRILREDIHAYIKKAVKHDDEEAAGDSRLPLGIMLRPWPTLDFRQFGDTEEIEMERIQRISSANLQRNWVIIPHVTQFDEADITEVEAFRKQHNIELEKKQTNVKMTLLVFIIKAIANTLEELPRFNSSLAEETHKLILKKYVNIGVAVDTMNGLVVPVLRDVNKKGMVALSSELTVISNKARAGKLTASDMQGGCFTISSLGGIGGKFFTPIVNAPEVAILGVSKAAMKPVWNGNEFVPRLMLPLALSYDHRVIDGADGARFISFLNHLLSDIRRLLM
ncbi:Dihydrolipoyllysine-residue acetyltransferase component of pyruvate dehydrogenase complex [Candidatus Moranella endobia PCVAL]|uniref:Acetyltransferase component of pyruvate dehydrogenase complex n=1 Tax=Moranella endobia (strain PCIT) TaxID=903503 RepID=F7XXL9_MOREP|nr:dihydrolipoyllysine-residue acetyltransferase [Candidatus Moranella endobia]AEI74845.1 putative dihydrolipoyllysine-residue acetyltransferase [Candidatus Moranella endobia PCIT]AGJ61091.1 Dihydrolipoyllysine-residue acetyltransferase component of pyruvate dehydrogenase complex [Candidatus Moranella endobia PCVAL]